MSKTKARGIFFALLAAMLYALSTPFSKLFLNSFGSAMMAALLYLGAGAGIFLVRLIKRNAQGPSKEKPLAQADLPYVLGMVLLDIAAPILLMQGLKLSSAASVALLNNFEIVATALIALLLFREKISGRLWGAIALITLASALLSFTGLESLRFSPGSLLVLGAAVCWSFENNCTRRLSDKDPLAIVTIKGLCSGSGSLVIALLLKEQAGGWALCLGVLLLGFVAYGLSITFYILAQRSLGAARTSAYYAAAPFIGVALSMVLFRQMPGPLYWIALLLMLAGSVLAV